ncbi:MAG: acyltransferase, partial [Alistipes sp.]|nr:acyltransferase [Alistipes sp.]
MDSFDNIFSIGGEADFAREALATFRFQAERCAVYREYIERIGVAAADVVDWRDIPMLPIGFFKWRDVYCGAAAPEKVFTSSNTGGGDASRHAMESLALYERAFTAAFERFYGEPRRWSLYGLLPNYLSREGSSLVYMCDRLIAACGSGGFYLDQYERLIDDMARDPKPKILLGVSYALWDLAERYAPKLRDTVVMETGGMKGRREELPKEEFHRILCDAFGVDAVHSEYGMAELTSQAYSDGRGIFRAPSWMRVLVRDVNDPFCRLADGQRGGLDIIDLANRSSCAFISTQDVGRTFADGSFAVEGRIDRSET